MKRRVHYDDRGVPQSTTVEYSQEDIRRGGYQLLRLFFLLPLIGSGYFAWTAAKVLDWHPMFALVAGFAVPIVGGVLLHFMPWLRFIYDVAVTLAVAVVAFLLVRSGGDLVWAAGAAALAILIGVWMTWADMRSADD